MWQETAFLLLCSSLTWYRALKVVRSFCFLSAIRRISFLFLTLSASCSAQKKDFGVFVSPHNRGLLMAIDTE